MSGELINTGSGGITPFIGSTGLGEVIKPLQNEVHLFDSYVAGTSHLADHTPVDELRAGDKLTLKREDNKFDDNAIIVMDSSGRKVGYVPEKDNVVFARLMDAGKILSAKVTSKEQKGTFSKVRISIYLIDF